MDGKWNIVFFGTPEFAVPTLLKLRERHNVLAAVTQPDRPKNRGHKLHISPVKEAALRHGIEVLQPERLEDAEIPVADVYVVVAYGQIFREPLLHRPRLGCLNLHASLLPKYRGAAPIQRAIEAGETESGVCVMRMEKGLDTGDVLLCRKTDCADYTADRLERELAEMGADLMLQALSLIAEGRVRYLPQGEDFTYAKRITKEDFVYEADGTFRKNLQKLRAFGYLKAEIDGMRMKVFSIEYAAETEVSGVFLPCSDGAARVLELQPENGKRMSAGAYLLGRRNRMKESGEREEINGNPCADQI